jgi:hypothetical protein
MANLFLESGKVWSARNEHKCFSDEQKSYIFELRWFLPSATGVIHSLVLRQNKLCGTAINLKFCGIAAFLGVPVTKAGNSFADVDRLPAYTICVEILARREF